MKITRKYIPEIPISDFAEKHCLELVITERNLVKCTHLDTGSKYYADFKKTEVTDGRILSSAFGNGACPQEAVDDYVKRISYMTLVIDANKPERKEIEVPKLITVKIEEEE